MGKHNAHHCPNEEINSMLCKIQQEVEKYENSHANGLVIFVFVFLPSYALS